MVIFGHNSSYPPRRRPGYILIVTINYLRGENRVPVLAAMKLSRGEGAIFLSGIFKPLSSFSLITDITLLQRYLNRISIFDTFSLKTRTYTYAMAHVCIWTLAIEDFYFYVHIRYARYTNHFETPLSVKFETNLKWWNEANRNSDS